MFLHRLLSNASYSALCHRLLCPLSLTTVSLGTGYFVRWVPTGSPSRGGDVAVYVFDINQPSLLTPFYSVLSSVSVLRSFQLYSPLSHFVLPVLWPLQLHISL